MNYRADIDGLRAVSIIGVLLFHFEIYPFSGGFVGVDVFFVISGFLITNLIVTEVGATKAFNYKRFYIRRVRRLFPALIVTLFLTFIFCVLLFSPQHLGRASGALVSAIFSVSNFYFWNESSYFDTLSEFKPFLHTWSLSVEEQFYYVWPFVLVLLLTSFSKAKTFLTIALVVVISLLLNIVFSDGEVIILSYFSENIAAWFSDGATTIFYLTPFRIFELGIGALMVSVVHVRPKQDVFLEFILLLGLSFIVYAMLNFNKHMEFPSYNALLPTLGAALVIYAGRATFVGYILRSRLFVSIGLISYSLYLVHWPVYVFYKYYQFGEVESIDKVIIFTLSTLLAILMYHFVEKPFRYKKIGVHVPTKKFLKVSAMFTILLVSTATLAWTQHGWKWRVATPPADMVEQLKDSKAFHVQHYGGAGFPYKGFIYGGNPADIVLIGDSHARHYAQGLFALGKQRKNIFISSTSCLVLPGFTRVTAGENWDQLCPSALNSGLEALMKKPNSIVMVAEFWGFQLNHAGLLSPRKDMVFNESDEFSYQALFASLDKLKVLIGGRELLLVGHVPGAGNFDVTACYTRPSWFYSHVLCLEKSSVNKQGASFYKGNEMLARYAESRKHVTFINPYDALCSGEHCHSVQHDELMYSDSNHLSKKGSEEVIGYFEDEILRLMQ